MVGSSTICLQVFVVVSYAQILVTLFLLLLSITFFWILFLFLEKYIKIILFFSRILCDKIILSMLLRYVEIVFLFLR